MKSGKMTRNPWSFDAPRYDERTSDSINAGRHFGIGERQPVGHKDKPKTFVDVLPQHTFQFNLFNRAKAQEGTIEEDLIN